MAQARVSERGTPSSLFCPPPYSRLPWLHVQTHGLEFRVLTAAETARGKLLICHHQYHIGKLQKKIHQTSKNSSNKASRPTVICMSIRLTIPDNTRLKGSYKTCYIINFVNYAHNMWQREAAGYEALTSIVPVSYGDHSDQRRQPEGDLGHARALFGLLRSFWRSLKNMICAVPRFMEIDQ
eukprot:2918096-Pleurochrysis_carterae.AAC.2